MCFSFNSKMSDEEFKEIHLELVTKIEPLEYESEQTETENQDSTMSNSIDQNDATTKIIVEKFYSELTESQNKTHNQLKEVIVYYLLFDFDIL